MIHLGLDLGGTKIEIMALSPTGEELFRHRQPTPQGQYQATLSMMVDLVGLACQSISDEEYTLGVGMPGSMSLHTGLVRNANSTCLNDQPLADDLQEKLQHAVSFANDANCFALSEAVDGAGADAHSVFGVIIGTGVGAGLVIDGKPYHGANGIAGEWGHNPLPWMSEDEFPGTQCWCGQRGCIETWLSGPGLLADYRRRGGLGERVEELIDRHKVGDGLATACLDDYILRLGKSLAHVINVFDPNVIVLGGGLSNIEALYQRVTKVWSRYTFADRVDTQLLPPRFGDSSGVRGAVWLGAQSIQLRSGSTHE